MTVNKMKKTFVDLCEFLRVLRVKNLFPQRAPAVKKVLAEEPVLAVTVCEKRLMVPSYSLVPL
jgi:hypothetical protein